MSDCYVFYTFTNHSIIIQVMWNFFNIQPQDFIRNEIEESKSWYYVLYQVNEWGIMAVEGADGKWFCGINAYRSTRMEKVAEVMAELCGE